MSGNDEIIGPNGSPLENALGSDGKSIDVNIQDQTTPAFDVFFTLELGRTTLVLDANEDEYTMTLATGHGFVIGNRITLFDTTNVKIFLAEVINVVGDVITVDSPIDFDFIVANTIVVRGTHELNVDGSITRQTFAVEPYIPIEVDITRLMFKIICSNPPEFDLFGDLPALIRGVVIRKTDGSTVNLLNVKTNGELANLMYDVTFYDQTKVQGVNGVVGRLTYGGPSKHGVTIRLEQGDRLELIVQDDLTNLESFRVIASGHIVDIK